MCFMCLPYLRSRVHFHPLYLRRQNFFSQSEGLALKPWGGLSLSVKDSGVCLFDYSLFLHGKILQKLQKKSQIRSFMVLYTAGQFTGSYAATLFIFHIAGVKPVVTVEKLIVKQWPIQSTITSVDVFHELWLDQIVTYSNVKKRSQFKLFTLKYMQLIYASNKLWAVCM